MESVGERINVCTSSVSYLRVCFLFRSQLVDLKAELYRKQEQFKKEKLGQESTGSISKPKDKVS